VRSRTRSVRTAAKKQGVSGVAGVGIEALRERGQGAVETLGPKIETARDALAPKIETARDALAPRIESARETLGPKIETARETLGPKIESARETLTPKIETARDQAVTTVREKVAPMVAQAIANAAEASAPTRKEAKNRADAAIAALRGEVGPPRRKRRWHRMSFLLGAGAITGAVAALVIRRKEPAFPAYEPLTGGPDPYAQPTNTQPPQAPITTLNEEIAGNVSPAPQAPETETESGNGAAPQPTGADTTGANETIDVTDQPVTLGTEAGTEAGATGGRHRKRTRRGEPE
jgi:hypothetical protein